MPQTFSVFLLSIACTSLLISCSNFSGDWPSLSDPISTQSDMIKDTRAHTTGQPAPAEPYSIEQKTALTKSVAIKQMTVIRAKLEKAQTAYHAAWGALQEHTRAGSNADTEEINTRWHDTQLYLTRYSTILNKLDFIINSTQLKDVPVWHNAKKLQTTEEAYIANERQKLMGLKPE